MFSSILPLVPFLLGISLGMPRTFFSILYLNLSTLKTNGKGLGFEAVAS